MVSADLGRRLRKLVDGMHLARFALCDKEIKVRDTVIPSKQERYLYSI